MILGLEFSLFNLCDSIFQLRFKLFDYGFLLFNSGFGFLLFEFGLDLYCSIYGDEACVVLRVVVLISDACVVVLFVYGFCMLLFLKLVLLFLLLC